MSIFSSLYKQKEENIKNFKRPSIDKKKQAIAKKMINHTYKHVAKGSWAEASKRAHLSSLN